MDMSKISKSEIDSINISTHLEQQIDKIYQ